MYGTGISLLIGFFAVILQAVLGVTIGLLSGYIGGMLDSFLMRLADIQLSLSSNVPEETLVRLDRGTLQQVLTGILANAVEAIDGKTVGPAAIIDACFAGSSELMLRQPAIPALHAVTTTNAMQIQIDTPQGMAWLSIIYYLTKLDHLLCVPALIFLFLGPKTLDPFLHSGL